jgi:hypothetical protein
MSLPVTISGAGASGINFTGQPVVITGAIAVDTTIAHDTSSASTSNTTPAFSTKSANELLLAFVASDYRSGPNTTVKLVTGAALTWTLVARTNQQSGTAEIWRAFATGPLANVTVKATLSQSVVSSLTVVAFTGASGAVGKVASGSARSGAPSATLVTSQNNSWIWGVGNDFDNATPRTPVAGQSLVHQDLSPTGDTYWVQQMNTVTPLAGTSVTMSDTAPIGDRYNLTIVEITHN